MFSIFSPRGNTEIVNQSHMVGACPPPRVKHFYRESLFPTHCFRRHLFFDFFRYYNCTSSRTIHCFSITLVLVPHILREDELATYPQGGWALEQLVVLLLPWYLSPYILREDELVTYPQGGWALEQFVVLLLPWCLTPHILREDELATYPQGGWARGPLSVLPIILGFLLP